MAVTVNRIHRRVRDPKTPDRITLRLDPSTRSQLERACRRSNHSLSYVARQALARFLQAPAEAPSIEELAKVLKLHAGASPDEVRLALEELLVTLAPEPIAPEASTGDSLAPDPEVSRATASLRSAGYHGPVRKLTGAQLRTAKANAVRRG